MYKNLMAEIARNCVSKKEVSEVLGITTNSLRLKLRGVSPFTVPESKKLLDLFKPKGFEYLFAAE